ncbi:MAG: GNAT family N-acetyltransferase [Eubacteriales bacterium]|nr:GNAT family N-acetyltransferase [Eubacteriales bacterium]
MENILRIEKAADSTDIITIETLARQIWEQHYTPIIGADQVTYMLENFQSRSAIENDIASGYIYYIAYAADIPCGYCSIKHDDDGLFLSKLYVRQAHRGKGIARAMLEHIDAYAKQHGMNRIRLTCNKRNTGSLSAYQKLGFAQIDACVTDIGGGFVMNDYVLEKLLD